MMKRAPWCFLSFFPVMIILPCVAKKCNCSTLYFVFTTLTRLIYAHFSSKFTSVPAWFKVLTLRVPIFTYILLLPDVVRVTSRSDHHCSKNEGNILSTTILLCRSFFTCAPSTFSSLLLLTCCELRDVYRSSSHPLHPARSFFWDYSFLTWIAFLRGLHLPRSHEGLRIHNPFFYKRFTPNTASAIKIARGYWS